MCFWNNNVFPPDGKSDFAVPVSRFDLAEWYLNGCVVLALVKQMKTIRSYWK